MLKRHCLDIYDPRFVSRLFAYGVEFAEKFDLEIAAGVPFNINVSSKYKYVMLTFLFVSKNPPVAH
jgi:hypothetical protein